MINICVIEDNKDDFNDIIEHLEDCGLDLKKDHNIGTKVTGMFTPDVSYEDLITTLEENKVNILVLDYELKWKDGRHYTGLDVLKKILDAGIAKPFVFFTSGLFESNPEFVGQFVIDGYSEHFDSRTLLKDHFFEESKIPKTVLYLVDIASNFSGTVVFDLYAYPLHDPKKYLKSENFFTFKSMLDRESTTDIGEVAFSQDQILCIIISKDSKKFLLISTNEIESSYFTVLKDVKDYTIKNLESKLKICHIDLVNSGKKIIYNPDLMEEYSEKGPKNLEIHIKGNAFSNRRDLRKFYDLLDEELSGIEKAGEKEKLVPESYHEVNPFYNALKMIK